MKSMRWSSFGGDQQLLRNLRMYMLPPAYYRPLDLYAKFSYYGNVVGKWHGSTFKPELRNFVERIFRAKCISCQKVATVLRKSKANTDLSVRVASIWTLAGRYSALTAC